MMKQYLLALSLLLIGSNVIFAQTGTDFWFVAPEVTESGNHDRPVYLKISTTASAATVTISQPAQPNGAGINALPTYTIQPYSLVTIDLTAYIDQIESGIISHNTHNDDEIEKKGIHITSTAGISCYYEVKGMDLASTSDYWRKFIWNSEIFTLKGTAALGTKFYTPFQTTLPNNFDGWSAIHIVATEDNTKVTIVPTKDLVRRSAGVPYSIILNKGETYCGRAQRQGGVDHPGGTVITSDKPIAVTIKDDSVKQDANGETGSDLIGDQIVPVSTVGTDYIAVKGLLYTNGNSLGDRAIICATHDATIITANGAYLTTLNAGQQFDYQVAQPSVYIQSSFPSYVFQTSGVGNELAGTLLPPIKCTGSNSSSFTRDTDEQFFMNILIKTAYVSNFLLNGAQSPLITSAQFTTVPNTPVAGEWSFAHIPFSKDDIKTDYPYTVSNTAGFFHLGVLNGDNKNSSARLGYFSDYKSNAVTLGSDVTICSGQPHQFKIGPGYSNIYWNGKLTNDSNFTTSTPGKITVTAERPGCVASASVNLFADSVSNAGILGKDIAVCTGSNVTLNTTGKVGKIVRWESSTNKFNTATPITNTSTTLSLGTLTTVDTSKITFYRAVAQSGVCGAAYSNPIKVQVDPTPTTSSITGSDHLTVCRNSSQLTGNEPKVGVGVWTLVSGSGTIENNSAFETNVTNLALGNNVFKWTITNGSCASITNTTQTIIYKNCPIYADFTILHDSICGADSAITFSDNSKGASAYIWDFGKDASLKGATTVGPHKVTYSTPGTKIITLTVTGPGGTSAPTTHTAYVSFKPTISNAGSDMIDSLQCGKIRVRLNANKALVGTGLWTIKSGIDGLLSDAKSNVSDFVGLPGNNYILEWQISNRPCATSASQIKVSFPKNPDVSKPKTDKSGGELCGQTQVQLIGNKPAVGIGSWTIKSGIGGNLVAPKKDTSAFIGLSGNTYVVSYTISNGPCIGFPTDLNVYFPKATPKADAGIDQLDAAMCGLSHTTLKAAKPTAGSGTWSIINNLVGGFENGNSPVTEFVGTPGNSYLVSWTITNPPCESSRDTVKVGFPQKPDVASAGTIQTICTSTATLGGNKPLTGTGKWSLVSGAGKITDVSSFKSSVTDLGVGTNVFQWKVATPVCGADSDITKINVDPATVGGTIGNDTTVCQNSKGIITLSGQTGHITQWESSTDDFATPPHIISNTSPTQPYENLAVTTKYRAFIQSGVCKSTYSNSVALKIKENPDFKLTTDTVICEGTEYKLMAPFGYTNFRWDDESTNQMRIIRKPGVYKVTAIDKYRCKVSAISNIVGCEESFYDVITPNGDSLNEVFIIRGLVPESDLTIYNRWGQQVFSKHNYQNNWDGGSYSDGVYLFIYTKPNGDSRTGYIQIIR